MLSNVKLHQFRIVFQHLKNLATHHKSWNQAVKDHIVVFALLRQLDPIIHGLGCLQDRLDLGFEVELVLQLLDQAMLDESLGGCVDAGFRLPCVSCGCERTRSRAAHLAAAETHRHNTQVVAVGEELGLYLRCGRHVGV